MRAAVSFLLALAIHAAVVLSAFVYFPSRFSAGQQSVIVPIDLVTLGETTNIMAARTEAQPEPEPEIEPTPTPETQPDTVAEPERAPEAEPEVIAAEPDAPVEPEPQAEPEAEPVVTPEPTRTPPPRAEPSGLDLDSLSQLLDRSRTSSTPSTDNTGDAARNAAGSGNAMTATLADMMSSQIARCARSNADAPSSMNLAVLVEVRLERDGSLSSPPRLVDEARVLGSSNAFLRVAGQRALRAVNDCAPYRMPADRYQQWRLLEVNVDTQR